MSGADRTIYSIVGLNLVSFTTILVYAGGAVVEFWPNAPMPFGWSPVPLTGYSALFTMLFGTFALVCLQTFSQAKQR